MAVDLVTGDSLFPASELISLVIESIIEIVVAADNVLVKKDSFMELSSYMEKIVPILKELNQKDVDSDILNKFIEILNRETNAARHLTLECGKRNKVYLLMNCRMIVRRVEEITKEISRALSLLPLASLDLASVTAEEIEKLYNNMQRAEFKAAVIEEAILEKIETGIQLRNVGRSYANNLLILIAGALGIPTEKSVLKKEFEEFKSEIENTRLRKDQAEAIQMDQIIALLERADATSSPKEKEIKHFTKRKSLGGQPLEPLQSFYCPITRDVMADPVETSSGQTFERTAIEKWFADGNKLCPLTMTTLNTSVLRPNKTLRQSIEEWKDRNTMITIASMKPKLMSEEEEEVIHCLDQLRQICEHREQHQEWVILENYIPTLIQLLGKKFRDVRSRVLIILHILVKDNDDAKERVAKFDNPIEPMVRSLGRRIEERKLAVALLLELSKFHVLRDCFGKVQGCILLLVTMSSSDDNQAAKDAQELLENLSFSDQNVILMARANYFKHLLHRLSTDLFIHAGPEHVKMIMATTLADMELTDHNKVSLVEGGVLGPLLYLVSHGDMLMKNAVVKALYNLSTVAKNGLQMIREGAKGPLFNLLLHHKSSTPSLRELVAATIMQLATSTVSQEFGQTPVTLLESDDDIFMLLSVISLTGPGVQKSILQTFHTLCQSHTATYMKTKLTECSGIQVLVLLCEHDDLDVRANAVKLFCCLADDGDEATILEHVGKKCLETLVRIIQSSSNEEEVVSAMGIVSSLPEISPITQWLLDAGALPTVLSILRNSRQNDPSRIQLVENVVGAMRRFTVPTNLEWQKRAAEAGVIPLLVWLLELGSPLTKKYAAISLGRFSESSVGLSRIMPKHRGLWCFSSPPETICPVHRGICAVESSFCLIEADVVGPLVKVLEEPDPGVCESSLDALLTLIEGERLQSGSKVLAEAKAIQPMIKFLSSPSPTLQEKSLNALERIFRIPEFKQKYGPSAQFPLVDLTQRGSSRMKSLSARVLAHLNVLHDQSSYF